MWLPLHRAATFPLLLSFFFGGQRRRASIILFADAHQHTAVHTHPERERPLHSNASVASIFRVAFVASTPATVGKRQKCQPKLQFKSSNNNNNDNITAITTTTKATTANMPYVLLKNYNAIVCHWHPKGKTLHKGKGKAKSRTSTGTGTTWNRCCCCSYCCYCWCFCWALLPDTLALGLVRLTVAAAAPTDGSLSI